MKMIYYVIGAGSVPAAVGAFAMAASDIQLILGMQLLTLAVTSWGIGVILSRQAQRGD